MRMVVIEVLTWLSGRIGGAAKSVIPGRGDVVRDGGRDPSEGGKSASFGD